MDFKENLKIGGGPVETKMDFFNRQQISLLGFAVIYLKSGIKQTDYYSFLSEQLAHDSLFAGNCLNKLIYNNNLSMFENITLWTDGGHHFKSQEFLNFQYKLYFNNLLINLMVLHLNNLYIWFVFVFLI